MTIKLRLMLLIATGLVTALIMSLASYVGNALTTFNSAFSQLEDQMASLSELIENNTQQTSAGTRQTIANANFTLGAV